MLKSTWFLLHPGRRSSSPREYILLRHSMKTTYRLSSKELSIFFVMNTADQEIDFIFDLSG
jgi:hypothetical protein